MKDTVTVLAENLEERLVYELSYLRAELQWQKESGQTFLQFQERMPSYFI